MASLDNRIASARLTLPNHTQFYMTLQLGHIFLQLHAKDRCEQLHLRMMTDSADILGFLLYKDIL